MKTRIITSIGMSVTFLGAFATTAFAETLPTMNQPNNGFYEGPNPEWATLHATDAQGTPEHRQYHRDAEGTQLQWHAENRPERGTTAYDNARRVFHQNRNMDHRHFHTNPITEESSVSTPASSDEQETAALVLSADTVSYADHTYIGRPSRRSIIAEAEERNRMRLE